LVHPAVTRPSGAPIGCSAAAWYQIVKTLRPLRSATITLNGSQIEVPPRIPDEAQRLLDALNGGH
jgi:hypothetical protein